MIAAKPITINKIERPARFLGASGIAASVPFQASASSKSRRQNAHSPKCRSTSARSSASIVPATIRANAS